MSLPGAALGNPPHLPCPAIPIPGCLAVQAAASLAKRLRPGERAREREAPTRKLRQTDQEQSGLCTCHMDELFCVQRFAIRKT